MSRSRIVFLDSASVPDAEETASSGCLAGITTNPSLLAREERRPLEQMEALPAAFPVLVFYQPASTDPSTALAEIRDVARSWRAEPQDVTPLVYGFRGRPTSSRDRLLRSAHFG